MKPTLTFLILSMVIVLINNNYVNAWGGIYNKNRFSPEMMQNMGYGAPHRVYDLEVG